MNRKIEKHNNLKLYVRIFNKLIQYEFLINARVI